MQINISTRHGNLSSETREKITVKVEKLRRFSDRLSSIDVTVDLENKDHPTVEIRVRVEKSTDLVATDDHESLMAGIDSCLHKVEQQLKKHKEKVVGHRGVTGRRTPIESEGDSGEE